MGVASWPSGLKRHASDHEVGGSNPGMDFKNFNNPLDCEVVALGKCTSHQLPLTLWKVSTVLLVTSKSHLTKMSKLAKLSRKTEQQVKRSSTAGSLDEESGLHCRITSRKIKQKIPKKSKKIPICPKWRNWSDEREGVDRNYKKIPKKSQKIPICQKW